MRSTRKDDVRRWWRTVNAMSGRFGGSSQFTLERDGVVLPETELAECLNHYLENEARDIPPLGMSSLLISSRISTTEWGSTFGAPS